MRMVSVARFLCTAAKRIPRAGFSRALSSYALGEIPREWSDNIETRDMGPLYSFRCFSRAARICCARVDLPEDGKPARVMSAMSGRRGVTA